MRKSPKSITWIALLSLLVVVAALVWPRATAAAAVPVHLSEGTTHAFIALRTLDGKLLATGDHRQLVRNGKIESSRAFHFKDGSVWNETVLFTQQGIFEMQR